MVFYPRIGQEQGGGEERLNHSPLALPQHGILFFDGLTSCLGAGLQLEPEQDPPYAPPFLRLDASPLDGKADCLKRKYTGGHETTLKQS